MHVKIIVIA